MKLEIEKLNLLIEANEIDKIIEYAKELSQNDFEDFAKHLLNELASTKNGNIRNTIAYLLGELHCDDAIPVLVKLIFLPSLRNNRGSLVYALEKLKCGNYLLQLIPLLYNGNFEVKLNTYTLLQNKIAEMPGEDKDKSIKMIKDKIEELEDTLDLLYDVYESIFEEKVELE